MQVDWLTSQSHVDETAGFFAESIKSGPTYISHSELMWGRAISPSEWSPDLLDNTRREFSKAASLGEDRDSGVLRCLVDGELVGVALLRFEDDAPIPFGVLEDIVVAPGARSNGIGQQLMDWVVDCMKARQLRRIFLESGASNEAHHWFERNGFRQVSISMMKDL